MKRLTASLLFMVLLLSAGGCDTFLSQDPVGILTEEEVLSSPDLIVSVLSNYYARLPTYKSLAGNPEEWARIDEAVFSGGGGDFVNNLGTYPYDLWSLYGGENGYGLIGDLNTFIERLENAEQLREEERARFIAEARFLRAYVYFELVKRMGGVPIITEQFEYEGPRTVEALQFPRNTEKEVYDFISSEIDAILEDLPASGASKTRANKWMALAMKSRAMLYAGSIAKYNSKTPSVRLPGNLVGMTDADPTVYYEQALAATEQIITGGPYRLYNQNPNKKENFYEAIVNESNNPEVIWAKDYTIASRDDAHLFNYHVMPRSARDDNLNSASLSPSLDLVEAYEYQDGSSGEIQTCQDASVTGRCIENGSNYVYYEEKDDPFENKDPRLWGTIMYPGSTYRNESLNFQAGVAVWDASTNSYDFVTGNLGSEYTDGGTLTGVDGPSATDIHTSNTGFYLRKFVSTEPNTGNRGKGSGVWWVRYRYAEVLLNAAEAAFELGQEAKALGYINQVRERAGMPRLTSLTLQDFIHARRVELAFEGHRYYDLKRWRIAHEVWNGTVQSDPAVISALFPYRVIRPGDSSKDGTYIYVKRRASRHEVPRFFRLGNYYSEIPQEAINNNPELVENPFH